MERTPYPGDVADDEWTFLAPRLVLMRDDVPQRQYPLREVYNGLRWMVRSRTQLTHDPARPAAVAGQLLALTGGSILRAR